MLEAELESYWQILPLMSSNNSEICESAVIHRGIESRLLYQE
jgi:hypothetical protein